MIKLKKQTNIFKAVEITVQIKQLSIKNKLFNLTIINNLLQLKMRIQILLCRFLIAVYLI